MSSTPRRTTSTDAVGGHGTATTATTWLFVPGDRPDRFGKAVAAGADLVVLDLEDAVAERDKDQARATVARWLGEGRAAVRVNGAATGHHRADLAALGGLQGLAAVVVPMAEDVDALAAVVAAVAPVPVVALVETALGIDRARELARVDGVARLALGHLDLAADLGSDTSWDAMVVARGTLVLASRLGGLPGPVDGVTTSVKDASRARSDALAAKGMGFTGKLCIHPSQVPVVAAALAPSVDEVAWARSVMAAADGGAAAVDGHMVDAPVIARARMLLGRVR